MTGDDVERLVLAYVRASLSGDRAAVRSLLADEVRLDWGSVVYSDPDDFAASCARGITWEDVEVIDVLVGTGRAAIVYEATNRDDGVRIRTSEHLRFDGKTIYAATVTFTTLPTE